MKSGWIQMGLAIGLLATVQSVQANVKVGDKAPIFISRSVNEKASFDLAAYKGKKPVLVNIINTWCSPCKWETPALVKMYAKYKSQIEFVTVITPWRNDTPEKGAKFAKSHSVPWMVTFDEDSVIATLYGVEGVPTNCVVGKDGKVLFFLAGGLIERSMETIFEAAVKGEAPKLEPRPAPVKKVEAPKTATPK